MALPTHTEVLVVGGGIHGVGVAQAAAAAGYQVVLLEKSQLADGTSSRSSKLIHGGLRYLETGQLRLVHESLRERELLLRLSPDLVHRLPFYIPVYPQTSRRPWKLRAGLALYTLLAGARVGTRYRSIPSRQWNSLDGLQTAALQAVFQYTDAQTDDRRLTRAVMRSAETLGAVRCENARFQRAEVRSDGCRTWFDWNGDEQMIHSLVVVNATGPWINQVLSQVTPAMPPIAMELVGGTHLELTGTLERGCYYLEAPQDGRAVFVMPWYDRILLGTTERPYHDSPDAIEPTQQETDYLLTVYRHYFPERSQEVVGSWAGLRVLPQAESAAFRRSRETRLMTNSSTQPRILSIVGGKLTAYRATAERVMRILQATLPKRHRQARTSELILTART